MPALALLLLSFLSDYSLASCPDSVQSDDSGRARQYIVPIISPKTDIDSYTLAIFDISWKGKALYPVHPYEKDLAKFRTAWRKALELLISLEPTNSGRTRLLNDLFLHERSLEEVLQQHPHYDLQEIRMLAFMFKAAAIGLLDEAGVQLPLEFVLNRPGPLIIESPDDVATFRRLLDLDENPSDE